MLGVKDIIGFFCIIFLFLLWGIFLKCWKCVGLFDLFLVFFEGLLIVFEILVIFWLFVYKGGRIFDVIGWEEVDVLGEIVCCFVSVVIEFVRFIVDVFCFLECWFRDFDLSIGGVGGGRMIVKIFVLELRLFFVINIVGIFGIDWVVFLFENFCWVNFFWIYDVLLS